MKIEKLKSENTAQWINCDLQNFDLKILVGSESGNKEKDDEHTKSPERKDEAEKSEYFDVLIVDPPWDIHMCLPYETLTDHQMIH